MGEHTAHDDTPTPAEHAGNIQTAHEHFLSLPVDNLAFACVSLNVSLGMLSHRVAELEHRCEALENGTEPEELTEEAATARALAVSQQYAEEGCAVARAELRATTDI